MSHSIRNGCVIAGVFTFVVLGCNAVLDNHSGVLRDDQSALTDSSAAPPDDPSPEDADPPDSSMAQMDATGDPAPGCAAGQQLCAGRCVSAIDPLFGCGKPSCAPCPSAHAAMGCQGTTCVVLACDRGYADCNASGKDGCEIDLSKPTSCGACNAVCAAIAPMCSPSGSSFQCTNGCAPDAPLKCGGECADPLVNPNHCGGCDTVCPAVLNGAAACVAGACTFTCGPLFHACAAGCASTTDPLACGPACAVCPIPPNAVAACAADACNFTCAAGFADCDVNAVTGCEAKLATDPLNCGKCGTSCAGRACVNGLCSLLPAPP